VSNVTLSLDEARDLSVEILVGHQTSTGNAISVAEALVAAEGDDSSPEWRCHSLRVGVGSAGNPVAGAAAFAESGACPAKRDRGLR